jgi:hypothetical protein
MGRGGGRGWLTFYTFVSRSLLFIESRPKRTPVYCLKMRWRQGRNRKWFNKRGEEKKEEEQDRNGGEK